MDTIMGIINEELVDQRGKKTNVTQPVLTELEKGVGLIL